MCHLPYTYMYLQRDVNIRSTDIGFDCREKERGKRRERGKREREREREGSDENKTTTQYACTCSSMNYHRNTSLDLGKTC